MNRPWTIWIKKILVDNNWNATELAQRAGVTPSTIYNYLNNPNHTKPRHDVLVRISAASGEMVPQEIAELYNALRLESVAHPTQNITWQLREGVAAIQVPTGLSEESWKELKRRIDLWMEAIRPKNSN